MKTIAIVAVLAVIPLVTVAAPPPPQPHTTTAKKATAKLNGGALSSKVTVAMPGDLSFGFKPGAGSQLATGYCLSCHSSAYVSTQPPLDRAHWTAEVTKMRKVYGAPIPDKDAETIVDYLTAAYGPS